MTTAGCSPGTSAINHDLGRLFGSDPAAMADPFPLWNRLRDDYPIHVYSDAHLFSRNKAVKALIDDPRAGHNAARFGKRAIAARDRLSEADKAAFDEISAFEAMYISRNDGEAHDRLRRIAQRTFTPRRVKLIAERIQEISDGLLAQLAGQTTFDLVPYAYQLPLIVIGDMLAIPREDLEKVHEWSNKLGRNRGGHEVQPLREAHQALGAFKAYIENLVSQIRQREREIDEVSLIGDLLDASQGETLSDAEMTAMFVVLLFAGHETTTNLIGSGVLALLQNDQWRRLRENPALVPGAVEEILRFVTPVQWTARVILEAMEIDGYALEAGDTVMLMLAAANRDPDVYTDANIMDIGRKEARSHLALGMGRHFCMGSPLARLEGQIALSSLVGMFPDLDLAADQFTWRGNAMLRGLAALPVIPSR